MLGTAFFFKQWGGKNKKVTGRWLHVRTYDEMPALVATHGASEAKQDAFI